MIVSILFACDSKSTTVVVVAVPIAAASTYSKIFSEHMKISTLPDSMAS